MKQYELDVVPVQGITLAKRTRDEWVLGYDFRVVSSTAPKYRRNDRITSVDVRNDEDRYDVKYTIRFQVETVKQYFRTMAKDDHAWEQAAVLMGYAE